MARSSSHALGQIIGHTMEVAFHDLLVEVAGADLFVDRQGPRAVRGTRKKVTWVDDHDNKHDLDFVLERGGSATRVGLPAAFIESAWRRYTKHSVNKAGEIANALIPLRRTYAHNRPFLGAIVAGEWTQGGLTHLESQGITVVHLPPSLIVRAFATVGIDAHFGEDTPADHMEAQVGKWAALPPRRRAQVSDAIRLEAREPFATFADRLRSHLSRRVESVFVLPLRGSAITAVSVPEALAALTALEKEPAVGELPLVRLEVQLRYSNTDRIEATFSTVAEAMLWLEQNQVEPPR